MARLTTLPSAHFRLAALNLVDEPVVVVDLSGSGGAPAYFTNRKSMGFLGADISCDWRRS